VPEAAPLAALLEAELATPVPDAVRAVADAIRARHDTVSAVLFYGSCLRRGTTEGVLDFYVLVDDYRAAHASRLAAWLGRALPPNVFYLELPRDGVTLRAKYAVISGRDFLHAAGPRALDCRVWSRFCQPARRVWARDAGAREAVLAAVERATRTAVERMLLWLPGDDALQRFRPAELWVQAFRETYRAELRGEKAETIDTIYGAQPERFDRVALAALRALEARGRLRLVEAGPELAVESDPRRRARGRRAWRLRRPVAKAIAVAGLVKTPLTFDAWVDYALWKVERHSGVRVTLTERQRRHPFRSAIPIALRLLRQRALR
jgi:hypothetical protein